MNKSNVFRSSPFHMHAGDRLIIIIKDETGTAVTVDLQEYDPIDLVVNEVAPGQPTVSAATNITSSSFSANWSLNENTTGFYLDVSTDSEFTSFVTGFENKNVGNVKTYSITGLMGLVTYYYRVRAYNDYGTSANSSTVEATTLIETVVDGDGNVYTYVTIGTQQWLVENLKTTKYIDGTAIPNLPDAGDWMADTTGSYCWYNNDVANKDIYGGLYNWYAVDNAHGLAPTGWRVPTLDDITALATALGGVGVAGGRLKEVGTTHWQTPNTGATDSDDFSALPGGWRIDTGFSALFAGIGQYGRFHTGTAADANNNKFFFMDYNTDDFTENSFDKGFGMSIRCVRDIS